MGMKLKGMKIVWLIGAILFLTFGATGVFFDLVMPRQPTPERQIRLHAGKGAQGYVYVSQSEYNGYQAIKVAGLTGICVGLIVLFYVKNFERKETKETKGEGGSV